MASWQTNYTSYLFVLALILLLSSAICAGDTFGEENMKKERAPHGVLFSNDTTNIRTVLSPYHERGKPFRDEMLEAAVDETADAGVEVHMLQPGLGWIPWWKSTVYPAEEHYQWFKQKTGLQPDDYGRYMLGGGDVVQVFIDRCRQRGVTPFVSLRLNDGHLLENVGRKNRHVAWISRFYEEHPEYRIGPDPRDWYQHVLNWAIPEVREHKFAFIKEICENYDVDGFELDFMRFFSYFQLDKTTSEKRAQIMTEFVAKVRELLDRTAKSGQHRWLCVRAPCYLEAHDPLGIDLPAMVSAGVDMVNLSASYYTEQQTDLPIIRKMMPDAAIYLEMTHCTALGVRVANGGYDSTLFRRTTDEQFYTAAHLAYARGADGVSTFNFAYYREYGDPARGPFNEPPFHIFNHLGDPESLARQPQHYFLARGWPVPYLSDRPIPQEVVPGQSAVFTLDMAPPGSGWKSDGRLRIQGGEPLGDTQWMARFNGVDLRQNSDVSEPYPNPYPPMLGNPEELRAWTVPVNLIRDGVNKIEIGMVQGKPAEITFLDLAVE